jgi:hypothetical protein
VQLVTIEYREPRFELQVIQRAITNAGGGVDYQFKTSEQRHFKPAQWAAFRDQHFDLQMFGITPETNNPVVASPTPPGL